MSPRIAFASRTGEVSADVARITEMMIANAKCSAVYKSLFLVYDSKSAYM